MAEKLNTNPENIQEQQEQNAWDTMGDEVSFAGERIEKLEAKKKEYLDIVFDLSEGLSVPLDHEEKYGIERTFRGVDDSSKYEERVGQMQIAAELIDAAMLREIYSRGETDHLVMATEFPKETEEYQSHIKSARICGKASLEAQQIGVEKLHEAYPGIDEKEASKRFFGYESWAINPYEITTVASTPDHNEVGKKFDAQHREISSERRPANPERAEKVAHAIKLREELWRGFSGVMVMSDEVASNIGNFWRFG